jgi:hypothetical protein
MFPFAIQKKKKGQIKMFLLLLLLSLAGDDTFNSLMPRLCRLKSQLMNQQSSSRSIKTWDAKIAPGSHWRCHLAKKSC